MDWMLWGLGLLAVAGGVSLGRALRARVLQRGAGWAGAGGLLAVGVAILGWASFSYLRDRREAGDAIAQLADRAARARIADVSQSELAVRFALAVALALLPLVLGIGFLPRRRPVDPP